MTILPEVTYTPCGTSSREQSGVIIMFTQFEEENILTKTSNNVESCDESENKSIMMSEQEMDAINSVDESEHDLIYTKMLEIICDGSQTHLNVNRKEAHYKIRDRIRQRQSEWKGALKLREVW